MMFSHRSLSLPPFFPNVVFGTTERPTSSNGSKIMKAASTTHLSINFHEGGCGCHSGAHG